AGVARPPQPDRQAVAARHGEVPDRDHRIRPVPALHPGTRRGRQDSGSGRDLRVAAGPGARRPRRRAPRPERPPALTTWVIVSADIGCGVATPNPMSAFSTMYPISGRPGRADRLD